MCDYQTALATASKESADEQCTKHVNAVLGKDEHGDPKIVGYKTDDWYDGSTVATFTNGWRRE